MSPHVLTVMIKTGNRPVEGNHVKTKEFNMMKRNAIIASLLSLFVPGLGQIYDHKMERGAAILIAVIIVGNLNAGWLNTYALSSTVPGDFFGFTLSRVLHDIFAFYGIIFWIWQVVDAYLIAKKG